MTLAHTRPVAAAGDSAGFRTAWAGVRQRATALRPARWSRTSQAKTAGIPIGPGERVLTLDHGPAGAPLVGATTAAVYIGGQSAPGRTWWRVGWEEVTRIGWDNRRSVLTLTGAGPGGIWRKELTLDGQSRLVELARERLSATLLASAVVRHSGRACAVVMARRQPGTGKVIWVTLLRHASEAEDQAIRAKAAVAIADLRSQTGIPAE